MPRNLFRALLCAAMMLCILLAPGCANKDPKELEHKAEKVVDEFLDAWSRGEPPDKFAGPDGPIQGTDPDWKAGYRLLSFLSEEVTQKQEQPDCVRCRVAIALQDQRGNKMDKKVDYDVQLGEKKTIRRVSP